jgi:exopolyphosphatase/guanosine-5'-triphosphate,3'-diphosphate pyrophosphatase
MAAHHTAGRRTEGAALQLGFPPGWLDRHPLTAADLRQEAQLLAAAGFTLRIEEG